MSTHAQMRLAHSIASMGLVPYARLVEAMGRRSSSVAIYKDLRQVFDQAAREQTLLRPTGLLAGRSSGWG